MLDYKQLIADNQPLSGKSEIENLTNFNYDCLAATLKQYLDQEHHFYEQLSEIIQNMCFNSFEKLS